jgi:GTPase SAR1 family protein
MRIAFFGACGTGKTTLVKSIYKELNLKPLYNKSYVLIIFVAVPAAMFLTSCIIKRENYIYFLIPPTIISQYSSYHPLGF